MNDIIKYVVTVLVTIVISMTGFWMMMGRNYITRAEAKEIAVEQVATVNNKLDLYLEREKELKQIIARNTDAINEFKVQSAALNQTLIHLQEEIKELDRHNRERADATTTFDTVPAGKATD